MRVAGQILTCQPHSASMGRQNKPWRRMGGWGDPREGFILTASRTWQATCGSGRKQVQFTEPLRSLLQCIGIASTPETLHSLS